LPTASGFLYWGDTNCDGQISPADTLRVLRQDAGLETFTPAGCLPMGSEAPVAGAVYLWGDVNCSASVDPIDAILLLRYDAGLPVNVPPDCPGMGQPV
jgi:hypothetical protein